MRGTYQIMNNTFFMDLAVSSFVSHSSLLTAKGVNLMIAYAGWLSFVPAKNYPWWLL